MAFRADGAPLQLVNKPKDKLSLLLWDVAKQQLVREFKMTAPANSGIRGMTLTPDGSRVAASCHSP